MKKTFYKIISNPLFSGSMVMLIGSNGINFLNYLYHLVMGRMLGPADYGELVALISITGLIGIVPGSISMVVIKYVSSAKTEGEISALVSWIKSITFKISLITFSLILLMTPLITSFLHINNSFYIILIAISILFSLPSMFNRSLLQGLLKFKELIIGILFENSTKLVLGVIFVFFGFEVIGAMFGWVISIIIGWFLTVIYIKFKKNNHEKPIIKPMILYAVPVIVQTVALTSLFTSDLILVKHFFSSHDAGIYASLSTLGKIIFFATGPIGTVMFPLISNRFSKGENYKKVFTYSFFSTILISICLLTIYGAFPGFVIHLLYGSSYLEASGILVWFGLFVSLFTLSNLIVSFNLSLSKTRVVAFPFIAAIFQIFFIWIYHPNLFSVVLTSVWVTALLLFGLLIYSGGKERLFVWR